MHLTRGRSNTQQIIQQTLDFTPWVFPSHQKRLTNVDVIPIIYAFRPRLRDRLTHGGITLPWKPQAFDERGFSPV
jgi:hypothetical protein